MLCLVSTPFVKILGGSRNILCRQWHPKPINGIKKVAGESFHIGGYELDPVRLDALGRIDRFLDEVAR